jgi:hypothetical protein
LPDIIDPNWLSGFTAGDGSFRITISKNSNVGIAPGYQVVAQFDLDVRRTDIE